MKRFPFSDNVRRAFTLIELLVVISIIAVLAAGVGIALRGGKPDASLRGAQGLVTSALSAARGQAALAQSDARIVVQGDSSREDFLRSIRIVTRDPLNPTTWKQVGTDILLPQDVYVVPPQGAFTSNVTFQADNGTWNSGRKSSFLEVADTNYGTDFTANKALVSETITSLGSVGGSGRIVVTAGRRTGPTVVVLDNAAAVRGLFISLYGVPALINEAASLDQD